MHSAAFSTVSGTIFFAKYVLTFSANIAATPNALIVLGTSIIYFCDNFFVTNS